MDSLGSFQEVGELWEVWATEDVAEKDTCADWNSEQVRAQLQDLPDGMGGLV